MVSFWDAKAAHFNCIKYGSYFAPKAFENEGIGFENSGPGFSPTRTSRKGNMGIPISGGDCRISGIFFISGLARF